MIQSGNVQQSGFQGSYVDAPQGTMNQIFQVGGFIVLGPVLHSQPMTMPLYQQSPYEQGLQLFWTPVWSNQGQPEQQQQKQRQPKPSKGQVGKGQDQKTSFEREVPASAPCQEGIKERANALLGWLRITSGNDACVSLAVAQFREMVFAEAPDCRAAQLALEEASATEQVTLLSGLKGLIRKAMQDRNANYTVTKAVEIMPAARIRFISQELSGHGREVARHRYGCRVICRLLEHSSQKDTSVIDLLEEVLVDAESLCTNAFGSIVMRHFLEHGLPEHRHRIAQALRQATALEKGEHTANIVVCSQQRKASHVVEAAFTFCSLEDQRVLADILLSSAEQMFTLSTGQFGRHVVLALLRAEDTLIRKRTTEALLPMQERLALNKCAKPVCSKLAEMEVSSDSSPAAVTFFPCAPSHALPLHALGGC